ncbi:glycosyltransferase [Nitrospirillum sp. BR 11828]|uniref:glycosyltransferase n=1 Tax=Nitrospirillum sp. BR 11828 TaxID=3104325 RepID=UPI002ACA639E|nr:glycosyltransferase [Nitrospirillum sp. BR 11828]MDZ5649149.1 glycosyltransferase [Nitrospirillum sp. BR 11828]
MDAPPPSSAPPPLGPRFPGRIAALIVAYRPDDGLAACLAAAAAVADSVHLFQQERGRDATDDARVDGAVAAAGASLATDTANIGLAAAQNRLAVQALAAGADWLLLLDQDSVARPGLRAAFAAALATAPADTGLLAARNVEPGVPDTPWVVSADGRRWTVVPRMEGPLLSDLLLAPASGSLVSAAAFRACGPLRDDFFIDWVDVEYALRLRRAGFRLVAVRDALVDHRLGALTQVLVGGRSLAVTHHGARRRWFQARNAVWTWRLHGRAVPALTGWTLRILASTVVKIAVLERGRGAKLAAVAGGLWRGLIQRPPEHPQGRPQG